MRQKSTAKRMSRPALAAALALVAIAAGISVRGQTVPALTTQVQALNSGATSTKQAVRLNRTATTVPVVPPGGAGRYGPAGRWPAGFPAYSTAATAITDGTPKGLYRALQQLDTSGGVIEHAGNLSNVTLTRLGTAPIVIRPPLGQRADFHLRNSKISGSGLLLAGWTLADIIRVGNAKNSGVAWSESDSSLYFITQATNGAETSGLMYEVVAPTYKGTDDRVRVNATGSGATATLDIVGSWLTGSTAAPPTHADTIQVLNQSGGSTHVTISDSVIWSSWDKALQGDGYNPVFTINRSWIASPPISSDFFPGISLNGYHAITAVSEVHDSTMLGSVNTGYPVTVSGSTLYQADGIVNAGGNSTVSNLPAPPPVKAHVELDQIWHN